MHTIETEIIKQLESLKLSVAKYRYKNLNNNLEEENDIKKIEELKISNRQLDILSLIIDENINTVSSISNYLELSISSVSTIVSKMVKQDLIEKVYDSKNDARTVLLVATNKGYESQTFVKSVFTKIFKKFLDTLDEETKELHDIMVEKTIEVFFELGIEPYDKTMSNEMKAKYFYRNINLIKKPYQKIFRDTKNTLKEKNMLTEKEIGILTLICDLNINTPSEISSFVCTTESTISTQLKTLMKKGFIVKEKHASDSRKTYFYANECGKENFEKCRAITNDVLIKTLSIFTEEKKISILESLKSANILFELLLKD